MRHSKTTKLPKKKKKRLGGMTGGFHKAATIRHVHRQHQLASSGQQCFSQGHQCVHPCHQVRGVKENVMTQKSIYKVLTSNGSLKDTTETIGWTKYKQNQ